MAAYDAGFKIAARMAGQHLAALAGVSSDRWEPIVSEVQTVERLADRVFRGRRDQQRFVVYMEAYARWTSAARWSVLAKSGLLSERERLPTVSLVYVLSPRGYHPQNGQFRLAVGGEPTQQVWFREVCLWPPARAVVGRRSGANGPVAVVPPGPAAARRADARGRGHRGQNARRHRPGEPADNARVLW